MKKFTYLLSLSATALVLAFTVMTGCEGPAGPAGEDGTVVCASCHNDNSDIYVKSLQAGNSKHQTGSAFERSDADCAACHTHEGFIDRMEAGTMEASADITQPSPPNCRTCHNIHVNYDLTDFDISYPDPVSLWINDISVDVGEGNVCANCHQPRIPDPMWELGGSDLNITDSRWGPHHSSQSAVLYGTGGYEISGSESYPAAGSNPHVNAGCTTCHMPDAFGDQAGGHTLRMTYEYHGSERDWVAGCTECHSSATDFDIGDVQTDVAELIDSLENILFDLDLLDEDGLLNASESTPLTVTADQAGAIYNLKFLDDDLSHGVHNPAYAMALLKNSIAAMSE